MDSGNAPLNLTFDSDACISASVFILREMVEPSCARLQALYKHFDFDFGESTLKGLGLGNHYSACQKMKCDELLYFTRRGRQSLHILSTVNVSGIVFFTQIYYIPIPVINTVFDLKIRITVLNRISPISLTGVCILTILCEVRTKQNPMRKTREAAPLSTINLSLQTVIKQSLFLCMVTLYDAKLLNAR